MKKTRVILTVDTEPSIAGAIADPVMHLLCWMSLCGESWKGKVKHWGLSPEPYNSST